MCRNIRPLYHYDPPATQAEIEDAARQFVRKVSGFQKPSQANQAAIDKATLEIAQIISELFDNLVTSAPLRNRAMEIPRKRSRAAK
jgi:hypothetical protein